MPHEAEKAMHNTLNTHHTSTGTRASGVSPSEPVSQARRKPSEECTATAITRHRRLRAGSAWDWSGLGLTWGLARGTDWPDPLFASPTPSSYSSSSPRRPPGEHQVAVGLTNAIILPFNASWCNARMELTRLMLIMLERVHSIAGV